MIIFCESNANAKNYIYVRSHVTQSYAFDSDYCLKLDCWQQCDLKHTPTTDSWWYVPAKNKQKLKSARLRRHEHKVNVGAKLRDKSAAINVESTADDAANDDSRLS
jgi:hypothetical protein